MGGNSTLHSTVSSDSVGTQEKFDLKSWQGLTELLKAGKNALKPEAYAEFRNLVLQYAQHGGDIEYKKRIDDVVATFGKPSAVPSKTISVETTNKKVFKDKPVHHARRVAPRFNDVPTPSPISTPHMSDVQKLVTEPVPTQEPVLATAPHRAPTVQEPIVEVQAHPVPDPVFESVPIVSKPEIPPSIDTQEVQSASNPVVQHEFESSQNDESCITREECKERIAEIKHAVNEHFGNPVALMAVPNNLGKIYMNALLTALKAATPGTQGKMDSAMIALEHAYKELIETDFVPPTTLPTESVPEPIVSPVPTPHVPDVVEPVTVPEPETVPEVIFESVVNEPVSSISDSVAEPTPFIPESVPEPISAPNTPEPLPIPEVTLPTIPEHSEDDTHKESILERIESEQSTLPIEKHIEASRLEEMHSAFEKTDNAISNVIGSVHKTLNPLPDSMSEYITDGVSDFEKWSADGESESSDIHTNADIEDPIAIRENKLTRKDAYYKNGNEALIEQGINTNDVIVKQAELFSSQISKSLDKMLHEWSIFAGSGFFGVGPGGVEHPLFEKLGPLSMGEVLAGRFDGADPKIVKIIKQYVDAWHHEQGVIFTLNETFEHYLRRVVQRISKRQNS